MSHSDTTSWGWVMLARATVGGDDLGTVADQSFLIKNFRLQSGTAMPQVTIVYETYGALAAGARNAVLITHGYTSSHHAAGRNSTNGDQPGWWDGLIGPGKAIDTDKLFVVSSNMFGSSFGSTNGASINPDTGKPYGPDFPSIAVRDIVTAEKACGTPSALSTSSLLPALPMAATRHSNGPSAILTSWTGSFRSSLPPAHGTSKKASPNWRRGSPQTPNGTVAGTMTREGPRRF